MKILKRWLERSRLYNTDRAQLAVGFRKYEIESDGENEPIGEWQAVTVSLLSESRWQSEM